MEEIKLTAAERKFLAGDEYRELVSRYTQKRKRKKQEPVSVRLQKKLIAMGFDVEKPERTYASGRWRLNGSWVWDAACTDNAEINYGSIGCTVTMKEALKMSPEELKEHLSV